QDDHRSPLSVSLHWSAEVEEIVTAVFTPHEDAIDLLDRGARRDGVTSGAQTFDVTICRDHQSLVRVANLVGRIGERPSRCGDAERHSAELVEWEKAGPRKNLHSEWSVYT